MIVKKYPTLKYYSARLPSHDTPEDFRPPYSGDGYCQRRTYASVSPELELARDVHPKDASPARVLQRRRGTMAKKTNKPVAKKAKKSKKLSAKKIHKTQTLLNVRGW